MHLKTLTTNILYYFLIGDWMIATVIDILFAEFGVTICSYCYLGSQLHPIAWFWLRVQLSNVRQYQLRWLVRTVFSYNSVIAFVEGIFLKLQTHVECTMQHLFASFVSYFIHHSWYMLLILSSFEDPGPIGNGRYSEHMLPEVEMSDFRKGAQVYFIIFLGSSASQHDMFSYRFYYFSRGKLRVLTKWLLLTSVIAIASFHLCGALQSTIGCFVDIGCIWTHFGVWLH